MKILAYYIFLLLITTFFIFGISNSINSQNSKHDSLLKLFDKAKQDTTRIKIYLEVGDLYKFENYDTSIFYYKKAIDLSSKAVAYYQTNPVTESVFSLLKAKSLRLSANTYYAKGGYDYSLEYFFKALKIYKKVSRLHPTLIEAKKGMAQCYNNIGLVYKDQASYSQSIDCFLKSVKIYSEIDDKKAISQSYNNIGIVYTEQGNYSKSIEYYLKSLKIKEEINDKKGMASCYNNIGNVHKDQLSFAQSIEYYHKAEKIYTELDDKMGLSQCYNNIGIVYYYKAQIFVNNEQTKQDFNTSIEYYNKALRISEQLDDKKAVAYGYNNIGITFSSMKNYTLAIEYYFKSLKIKEEFGDKKGIATVNANISGLYNTLADSASILNIDKSNKSWSEQKLIYLKNAEEYGIKAMVLAKEIESASLIYKVAEILLRTYKTLRNFDKYVEYTEIVKQTKDTLFSEEKTKAMANAEKKFETEKKQLLIEKLNKEKELQNETIARKDAESKKQKLIIWFVVSSLVLVILFLVFLYNLFLQKKKANVVIALKNQSLQLANAEINMQKEEILAQRDEIESQRDKLSIQNQVLYGQKKEITDSIYYAKRIQQAILPDFKNLGFGDLGLRNSEEDSQFVTSISNHFIFFKPKDIVSGDFYWANKLNDWLIITVADCTGHGVPGAFMSMLGISFLNEIVRKKEISKASEVLDHLRESIIEALQQKGNSGEQKDGMDMSLIAINLQTPNSMLQISNSKFQEEESEQNSVNNESLTNNKQQTSNFKPQTSNFFNAQWAGANNPLWLVRNVTQSSELLLDEVCQVKTHDRGSVDLGEDASTNNKLQASNIKLFEFKPDKQPVSIYEDMKPFTNHEFKIYKNDLIYLMSDGYEDQFGGTSDKKFLSKNLKELIIANCLLPMEAQKQVLEKTLIDWIACGEQIDDITVLGIKI